MIKVSGRIFVRLKVGSGIEHHAHILSILLVSIVTKSMIQMTRVWVAPTKRNKMGIIWKQQN